MRASTLPLDGRATRSDINSVGNGRTERDAQNAYGESRTRNGTGTYERIGKNFEDDPEEVKPTVLRKNTQYLTYKKCIVN